jgi:diadenosine tetraphosphate (Ap4A) HIT family hydrolase
MNCPFCRVQQTITKAYFTKEREKYDADRWIDYEEDPDGRLLWYAVLNGDQYVLGHTMVILAPVGDPPKHRSSMDDPTLVENEISAVARGIHRCCMRLRGKLAGIRAVHVLGLCEGIQHLHFHLLPRYDYREEHEQFYRKLYLPRARRLGHPEATIEDAIMTGNIHGMWYACFGETRFPFSEYYALSPEERAAQLSLLARRLRDPDRPPPPQ